MPMDTNVIKDLLLKEIDQTNEHARILFQVYIAWITFFITILLGAMATAIKASLRNGRVRYPQIVYFIATLFGIQVVLAILVCTGFQAELNRMDNRINTINANLIAASSAATNLPPVQYIKPQSTIPPMMYQAVTLGLSALISHLVLWGYLVFKIRKWSRTNKEVFGVPSD